MAYCRNCGKKLDEHARFCSYCGTQDDLSAAESPSPQNSRIRARAQKLQQNSTRYLTVYDTTSSFTKEDIAENRSVALLSYLHVLVLVPLFAMRESRFAQYHAQLGLNLLLYHLIAEILGVILVSALGWIPVLGVFIHILVWLCNLALWGVAIFGIVSAARGKAQELQMLRKFRLFK